MENFVRRVSVMRVLSWMLGCCLLAAVGMANAATQVLFETNQGNFAVEVYADKAPKTVENFLQYVKDGFYTNTIFHRVIGRFMIQGGGFDRELTEKPTRAPVVNEAGNGLVNQTGTIAMARTQDPNSATAQFFVNVADNQFLDYSSPEPDRIGYCVFGKVVSGMDVVFKISNLPTGNQRGFSDVPIRTVIIKRATIVTSK
jgi:cyclophilin family peptidyl-prolyl cis-trans isomerase